MATNKPGNKSVRLLLSGLALLCLLSGCTGNNDRAVAVQYCSSCHVFPEPALLPKNTWQHSVLPTMGAFADLYQDHTGKYKLLPQGLQYMRDPVIANIRTSIPPEAWDKIVAYYSKNAPDTLAMPSSSPVITDEHFSLVSPPKKSNAFTACVYYDEQTGYLFQSDIQKGLLRIFDNKLRQTDSLPNSSTVAVMPCGIGHYLITQIGSLNPRNASRNGKVEEISVVSGKITSRMLLCDSLYRPVQALKVGDDIAVCEFGYMNGALSLVSEGVKKSIVPLPGAEKMYTDDINGDGKEDLWVLFAQGREGIYQFINKGNGEFSMKTVCQFPPSYGSTYFELADMDGDGKKDIIYTCGDNADESPVLKPYHGVYIFRNTGSSYQQVYFRHLDGCYKAISADLDHNGLPDLSVISFFADYDHHPDLSLVYLLQKAPWQFELHANKQIATLGRWITLDVKDVDHDGKPDIIAGNMAAKPGNNTALMNSWILGPAFIIWKNQY